MGIKLNEVKFTIRIQKGTAELVRTEAKRRSLSIAAFIKNAIWRELQGVKEK